MTQPNLALTLYNLRDHVQTIPDMAATLKRVREIGYRAVQLSGLGPVPPAQLQAMLADADLIACVTHVDWDRLRSDTAAVIAEHKLWQCRHVAIGGVPDGYRNEQGWHRLAREASAIGQELQTAGLTFSYHNHYWELERFGDRTGLEILFAEADPAVVFAEIDTYWIQFGGGDPVAWIRRMKDRIPVVHLKDMGVHEGSQAMMEVGEGNLNWAAILAACREAGVEWHVVEQDFCAGDPFDSAARSHANLVSLGLC